MTESKLKGKHFGRHLLKSPVSSGRHEQELRDLGTRSHTGPDAKEWCPAVRKTFELIRLAEGEIGETVPLDLEG